MAPTSVTVRIRRLSPDVPLPAYQTSGAAAFDLSANENLVVRPGEVRLIGTGLVIEVPAGHFLAIVARSSLPVRKGLIVANGVGIVDSDYSGPDDEVKIEVYNFGAVDVAVTRGERLAQGLLLPAVRVAWEDVTEAFGASRGGFGATGGYGGSGEVGSEK